MVRFNGTFVDIGNIVPAPITLPATKVITQQIKWRGLMHYNPWIMPAALDFLVRTKDTYPLSKVVSAQLPALGRQQGLRDGGVAGQEHRHRGHAGHSGSPSSARVVTRRSPNGTQPAAGPEAMP